MNMERVNFSEEKLDLTYFNHVQSPQDVVRCQQTIMEFMDLVENNALQDAKGTRLMTDFCGLVNNEDVWHLAKMVVPQFRLSRLEQ